MQFTPTDNNSLSENEKNRHNIADTLMLEIMDMKFNRIVSNKRFKTSQRIS